MSRTSSSPLFLWMFSVLAATELIPDEPSENGSPPHDFFCFLPASGHTGASPPPPKGSHRALYLSAPDQSEDRMYM